jgi:hypothetical protein
MISTATAESHKQTQAKLMRQRRGGLARNLLLTLLPLVLGPLLVVAIVLYRQAQSDISNQVTAQLTSLAELKEQQLDQWIAARTRDMNALIQSPDLVANALILSMPDS